MNTKTDFLYTIQYVISSKTPCDSCTDLCFTIK